MALKVLERLGYQVDAASDGAEAVEAATASSYTAVLMDVQMPEMDGYAATREIRRREGDGPRMPIIAMTAHAMESDRQKALEAGMDDHITKPVKVEALREVLERRVVAGQTSTPPQSAASEGPVLDHAVLDHLRSLQGEDEPHLLKELMQMFFEDTEDRLARSR